MYRQFQAIVHVSCSVTWVQMYMWFSICWWGNYWTLSKQLNNRSAWLYRYPIILPGEWLPRSRCIDLYWSNLKYNLDWQGFKLLMTTSLNIKLCIGSVLMLKNNKIIALMTTQLVHNYLWRINNLFINNIMHVFANAFTCFLGCWGLWSSVFWHVPRKHLYKNLHFPTGFLYFSSNEAWK